MNSAGEYLMMGGEKEREEEEETLLEALEMATEIRKATNGRRCDLIRASCIVATDSAFGKTISQRAPHSLHQHLQ